MPVPPVDHSLACCYNPAAQYPREESLCPFTSVLMVGVP